MAGYYRIIADRLGQKDTIGCIVPQPTIAAGHPQAAMLAKLNTYVQLMVEGRLAAYKPSEIEPCGDPAFPLADPVPLQRETTPSDDPTRLGSIVCGAFLA